MRTLVAVLLAAVALAGCQTIVQPSLVVTVMAPQHGVAAPLSGARVLLSDKIHGGTTGSEGTVTVYGLSQGTYNFTVDYADQVIKGHVVVTNVTQHVTVLLNETAKPDLVVVAVHQLYQSECVNDPDAQGMGTCSPSPPRPSGFEPVAGAAVLLSDNVHGGVTNADGRYAFFDLHRGAYNVTVRSWAGMTTEPVVVGSEPVVVTITV